jgi:hypothetical protein
VRAQVRGLLFVLAAFFDGQDDVALPESRRRQLEHLANAGAGLGQRADQELVAVSGSAGIALCPARISCPPTCLRAADAALLHRQAARYGPGSTPGARQRPPEPDREPTRRLNGPTDLHSCRWAAPGEPLDLLS